MYQGDLDGLCGVYAIVNAFVRCGFDKNRSKDLFDFACRSLPAKHWPNVFLEGAGEPEMDEMISACMDSKFNEQGIGATYPIRARAPGNNGDFWKAFDDVFSDEKTCCAILHTWKPSDHWIVAHPHRKEIRFIDSARPRITLRSRDSLYAGDRRRSTSQWLINRKIMIAFSKP